MATSEPLPQEFFRPRQIASQRFTMARRGYDTAEVEAYLRVVAAQVEQLRGELEWLRATAERLELKNGSAQDAAYTRLASDFATTIREADEAAKRVLAEAEEEARVRLASVRERAEAAVAAAKQRAEESLTEARERAEGILAGAAEERDAIVARGRREADEAVARARAEAAALLAGTARAADTPHQRRLAGSGATQLPRSRETASGQTAPAGSRVNRASIWGEPEPLDETAPDKRRTGWDRIVWGSDEQTGGATGPLGEPGGQQPAGAARSADGDRQDDLGEHLDEDGEDLNLDLGLDASLFALFDPPDDGV